jgi:hypothetical protein
MSYAFSGQFQAYANIPAVLQRLPASSELVTRLVRCYGAWLCTCDVAMSFRCHHRIWTGQSLWLPATRWWAR